MNAENFAEVLKNPSQLYQISYQELKSLVLQYPYCRNLHHLLLEKSHIDHRTDFERVLEKTATYSIDRRYLYLKMRALQSQEETFSDSFELGEDFLELLDLNRQEKERQPIPLHILRDEEELSQTTANGKTIAPGLSDSDIFEVDPLEGEELSFPPLDLPVPEEMPIMPESKTHLEEAFLPDDALLLNLATGLEAVDQLRESAPSGAPLTPGHFSPAPPLLEDLTALLRAVEHLRTPQPVTMPPQDAPARPQPKPKSSFKSWVKQFQPAHLQPHIDELMENVKPKKKNPGRSRIASFAEQSLQEHEELVSETLAELLVQQSRHDKAIQMYHRLSLIFPEKSSYFAQIIKELQKHQ